MAHHHSTRGLFPITKRNVEAISSIEDAEWMEEDTAALHTELEEIKRDIVSGALY